MKLRHNPFPVSISNTAFAFRGYDVANLGRTPELLEHPDYGPVVEAALREGSEVVRKATGRHVDLVARVRRREESNGLATYAEDVALIVCVSVAQIRLLEQHFDTPLGKAKVAFGYSLGEASAAIATGMFPLSDLLNVPVSLADDSVALAHGVTMGVLFSRGKALEVSALQRLCLEINQKGDGVIGMSSILSPNCVLLLGQNGTIDRFSAQMRDRLTGAVALRKNPHRWPPLHTSITWQKAIPNRAGVMLQSIPGGLDVPAVPIISGVTGKPGYTAHTGRELLHQWVDHPQRLWDQIMGVLSAGVRTVVHVGPAPNLIPATFKRLSEDIRGQLGVSFGKRMVSRMVSRPWLAQLLPSKAVLLRAPTLHHIILEDWLLEQKAEIAGRKVEAKETVANQAA